MRMSGIKKRGVCNLMDCGDVFPQFCPWICQNGTSLQRRLAAVDFSQYHGFVLIFEFMPAISFIMLYVIRHPCFLFDWACRITARLCE
jgi:hypothetical protein